MNHADFAIGTEFETSTGQRWRCTDVGQRSILRVGRVTGKISLDLDLQTGTKLVGLNPTPSGGTTHALDPTIQHHPAE